MNPEQLKNTFSLSKSISRHGPGTLLCLASFLFLTACGSESASGPAPAVAEPSQAETTTGLADVTGQAVDPLELAAEVITEADFRRHIELLASDEFGGRAPASPGEELTVNYLVENFKNMGLEPANGDSYKQAVPLAWVEAANNPPLVLTGPDGKKMELSYPQEQVIWTRQQVAETSIEDSEMVFVGYGIVAPEYDWDDYEGVDVEGKTVVILVNDPGYATQNSDLFNGNAMTYYGRWGYKFDEANRHGAAGAIIIHDRLPAAYPWSTVENSWTGRQFDLERPDQGSSLLKLEGWIQRDNAKEVFAAAGLDLEELYEKALQPNFAAVPMGLKASATLVNQTEAVPSQNVAAILRGSEAPDEIFIYLAQDQKK